MLILNILIFLISCIILAKSGQLIVNTLTKLSLFLRLSEFKIGFILMAVSTTLPELFVGINSAINNNTALSLGNVLGANIINLTLVIGIVVLLSNKIETKGKAIQKTTFYMFVISLIPLTFMLNRSISRFEGLILVIIFFVYIINIGREKHPISCIDKSSNNLLSSFKNFGIFFLGIFLLIVSSRIVVNYGNKLASELFIPPILIGLIFVAIGTTLPELVFGIKSALSKHPKMSLGNLIGAVSVNSTLVLGVTALIKPITTADFTLFLVSSIVLVFITYFFFMFVRSNRKLSWKEGLMLIFIYILFLITEIILK